MKKITLTLLATLFAAAAIMAQAPKVPAKKGTNFGETVKADNAVSTDMLTDLLKRKRNCSCNSEGQSSGRV